MVAGEVELAEVGAAAGVGDGEVGVDGVYLVGLSMWLLLELVLVLLVLMLILMLCLVLILGRGMVRMVCVVGVITATSRTGSWPRRGTKARC